VPPTHPLFPQLFPERQICLEYAERVRHEAARKREGAVKAARSTSQTAFKSWEEHQSSKYGEARQSSSRMQLLTTAPLLSTGMEWRGSATARRPTARCVTAPSTCF
jgi:hypothetical protein